MVWKCLSLHEKKVSQKDFQNPIVSALPADGNVD